MKYPDFVVFPHVTVVHVQGLARTIHVQCIHGAFGREITKYTVTYGADIRFWPTLHVQLHFHIIFGFRLDLHGDLQPDCSADRPVTGPRQSAIYFQTQKKKDEKMCIS